MSSVETRSVLSNGHANGLANGWDYSQPELFATPCPETQGSFVETTFLKVKAELDAVLCLQGATLYEHLDPGNFLHLPHDYVQLMRSKARTGRATLYAQATVDAQDEETKRRICAKGRLILEPRDSELNESLRAEIPEPGELPVPPKPSFNSLPTDVSNALDFLRSNGFSRLINTENFPLLSALTASELWYLGYDADENRAQAVRRIEHSGGDDMGFPTPSEVEFEEVGEEAGSGS